MPVFALLLAASLWGMTWIPYREFHASGLDGLSIVLLAYGAAALAWAPGLWRGRQTLTGAGRDVAWLMLTAGVSNLAFALSMIHGDVIRAMLLFYLSPMWGVLGGALLLGERLTRRRVTGLLAALSGGVFIFGQEAFAGSPLAWIDLVAVAAGFFFALGNIFSRKCAQVDAAARTALVFAGGAAISAVFMVATMQPWPEDVAAKALVLTAGFGVVWIGLAIWLAHAALRYIEVGRASIIMTTELFVLVLSAFWLDGAVPEWYEWVGGALIFSSVMMEATERPDSV